MTKPAPEDPWKDAKPYVQATKIGRLVWSLTVVHSPLEQGAWFVLGRRWALNKAGRLLDRHRRTQPCCTKETREIIS